MNSALTQRLYKEFPNLYCDKDLPDTQSRMCDGFVCGDGWFDLVYKLSSQLERCIVEYKRTHRDDPKPPRAFQVKQKFGALCFYMSHLTEEMQNLIDEAERRSHGICEVCGSKGKLRVENYWNRTLCDKHHKKH